jgi:transcriptional pleiotropic regulator of transition state genes
LRRQANKKKDDAAIVLRKYQPGCVFCGETDGARQWRGKVVCGRCAAELAELVVSPAK